jgi:hypothetical protein
MRIHTLKYGQIIRGCSSVLAMALMALTGVMVTSPQASARAAAEATLAAPSHMRTLTAETARCRRGFCHHRRSCCRHHHRACKKCRPGQRGATGPTGARGPAGVSGREVVTRLVSLSANTSVVAVVPCGAGRRVLGGGYAFNELGARDNSLDVFTSRPSGDSAWEISIHNRSTTNFGIAVYAICAFAS